MTLKRWLYTLLSMPLMAVAVATGTPARAQAEVDRPTTIVAPVLTAIRFSGNSKLSAAQLNALTKLRAGDPLDAVTIKPDLKAIEEAYAARGGAIVSPHIDEVTLGKVTLTYVIKEGGKSWSETADTAPYPKFLDAFFGNTLVCAAAKTGEDLCHMWFNRDGTFVIFDPTGAHPGHFTVGKVRPDGRVPICRYWNSTVFVAPPAAGMMLPVRAPSKGPNGEVADTVCETKNFRSTCPRYPDIRVLSAEQQRKANRTMVERNHEEGMCYAHGPHKVGDVWFEWDDPLPGQLGLDREMLLPGHQ